MNAPTIAERPSLEQLQAELALLTNELANTRKTANDRASRGYHLQSVQTNVILGKATREELETAKTSQDEAVDALLRVPMLEQAVRNAEQAVEDSKHHQRVEHIRDIEQRYQTAFENYKRRSQQTLMAYRELQKLDNQFRAMGGNRILVGLLDAYHAELNLPVISGSLASRSNFTTGQE